MSILTVEDLRFSYDGERQILNGVSFTAEAGEALVLAGWSGCGKSTLCRCLCGVIPQSAEGVFSGSVTADGCAVSAAPLSESAQHIGMVFQNPDDMLVCSTVEDELAFGLENLCVPPAEIRARVDAMLARFSLTDLALRDPMTLSGGQKKLVSIAAALIMGPKILILDEPMTGLDAPSRDLVRTAVTELLQGGCTVVAVEHDLAMADYARRILYLREGRLYDQP